MASISKLVLLSCGAVLACGSEAETRSASSMPDASRTSGDASVLADAATDSGGGATASVSDAAFSDAALEDGGAGRDGGGTESDDASQPDPVSSFWDGGVPVYPDAGCHPSSIGGGMLFCSNDVRQTAYSDPGTDYCEWSEGCPLRWGCDNYETARMNAARCDMSFSGGVFSGRGMGLLLIEGNDEFDGTRGYYDADTGQLIGHVQTADFGRYCSGIVPEDWNFVPAYAQQLCPAEL